jgi:hypothetical protein
MRDMSEVLELVDVVEPEDAVEIYISPAEAAAMPWEEFLGRLACDEWDWRREFEGTKSLRPGA